MRIFRNYFLSLVVILGLAIPAPAQSEQAVEKTLRWLMSEPVTLMDLGMLRLREDLREAALSLVELGFTNIEPRVGTYYEWRQDTIYAYVAVREPFARPTEQSCLKIFERVIRGLSSKLPGQERAIGWYLESIFLHEGTGNYGRPARMKESLLEAIRFEVSLLPPNPMEDSRKVQCHGRMDAATEDISVTIS